MRYVQFPKTKICVNPNCGEFHSQDDHPFADMPAPFNRGRRTISLMRSKPQHFGMVVFEEGGRLMSDITDVDVGGVEVGMPMRMMFRVKEFDNQRGFAITWKAAPDLRKKTDRNRLSNLPALMLSLSKHEEGKTLGKPILQKLPDDGLAKREGNEDMATGIRTKSQFWHGLL
ncbi:MAG: hypothetical protein CM15mP75_0200 [Flammeovirgaceae bacterium]|nr:MAG: hypothetical protein CM15mP75_0200 [Flammeovirgaceae bacterium]